jgi:hypothetical protein
VIDLCFPEVVISLSHVTVSFLHLQIDIKYKKKRPLVGSKKNLHFHLTIIFLTKL